MIVNESQVRGHVVEMLRTHQRHLSPAPEPRDPEVGRNFADLLFGGIQATSDLQNQATDLMVQSIIQPEAVSADDVALAASKANLSLSLMKAVVDRALRAYNEIINMR